MPSSEQRMNELDELANRAKLTTLVEGARDTIGLEDGDGQPMVLRGDELELYDRATGIVEATVERLGRLRAHRLRELLEFDTVAASAGELKPFDEIVRGLRRELELELDQEQRESAQAYAESIYHLASTIVALEPLARRERDEDSAQDQAIRELSTENANLSAALERVSAAAHALPGGMFEGRLEELGAAINDLPDLRR